MKMESRGQILEGGSSIGWTWCLVGCGHEGKGGVGTLARAFGEFVDGYLKC